jgi:hypothetical protein
VGKDQYPDAGLAETLSALPPMASSLVKETLLVFDWDDTILPTSWLQRIHNTTGGFLLNQESQALLNSLITICEATLSLAAQMGTVIFITNSVPGWVDQSCQLFMPQLLETVRRFNIVARPMRRAPLTFKTSAFQREFRTFRNLVSIGDGNAERTATLRLQMISEGGFGVDAKDTQLQRSVKSVKLLELPNCQQLYAQHEMLHQRLAEIVRHQGHLDLKSRFSPAAIGKVGACSLMHFTRPFGSPPQPAIGGGVWPSPDDNTRMQGIISLRSIAPPSSNAGVSGAIPERAGNVAAGSGVQGARALARQLPTLSVGSGKKTGDPTETLHANGLFDHLREERAERVNGGVSELDGGTGAADSLYQAMGGAAMGASPADVMRSDPERCVSVAEDQLTLHDDRLEQCADAAEVGSGRRSVTPLIRNQGHWKVEHGPARTVYSKKRPVLAPGMATRSTGAVWRENSAPAATRGF